MCSFSDINHTCSCDWRLKNYKWECFSSIICLCGSMNAATHTVTLLPRKVVTSSHHFHHHLHNNTSKYCDKALNPCLFYRHFHSYREGSEKTARNKREKQNSKGSDAQWNVEEALEVLRCISALLFLETFQLKGWFSSFHLKHRAKIISNEIFGS